MDDSMLFTLGIAAWVGMSACVSTIAKERGRTSWAWFVISLLGSPIFAAILLVAAPLKPTEEEMNMTVECDACRKRIQLDAKICPYCRSDRNSEQSRVAYGN